jgi:DNA-binding transcriptional MerR regulator
MADERFHIGEAAERAGLSLRTVRYYEETGLIAPEARTEGGFRLYRQAQVERLFVIKRMKPLGFSLQEMREVLDATDVLAEPDADTAARDAAVAVLAGYARSVDERCVTLREQLATGLEFARELRQRVADHDAAANPAPS